MIEEIRKLRGRLENLGRKSLQIKASGKYPNRLEVAKNAKWQNDGTDRITPAKFVEAAESQNRGWRSEAMHAAWDFILGGGDVALLKLGLRISEDISAACNRIDTGRLKGSFLPKVETK